MIMNIHHDPNLNSSLLRTSFKFEDKTPVAKHESWSMKRFVIPIHVCSNTMESTSNP